MFAKKNVTTSKALFTAMMLFLFTATAHAGRDKSQRDHKFQAVVNLTTGTGWYMVAPYEKDDPARACSEPDDSGDRDPVCSGRSSWYMDFLAGFGVRPGLELLFMYRQGVESPSFGSPQTRRIGGGFKIYKPSGSLIKMGFGVIPLFDFSDRREGASENGDFVIHIPILLQVDIIRWLGVYGQVAPNISFVSEFRFDINFGIGVQGRFP